MNSRLIHQPPPGGLRAAGHGPDAARTDRSPIVPGGCDLDAPDAASGPILSCPLCNDTQHVAGYGSGAAEPCQLCIGRAS